MSNLEARLGDLVRLAERGQVAISDFLSPADCRRADTFLGRTGIPHVAFGGYDEAERQRMYLLPSYMESDEDEPLSQRLAQYGHSDGIALLLVRGSGYVTLSHRSYLGSLLGLGLERDVIGDIVVLDESGKEAVVFCDEQIVPFLLLEWKKVGSDTVKVTKTSHSDVVLPPRRTAPIVDTVASPRLDAVVAALCNLSRERARTMVSDGCVEVDFEQEERPDFSLVAPCMVSVRGYGRFRVTSVSEQTKKGRIRLLGEKFL